MQIRRPEATTETTDTQDQGFTLIELLVVVLIIGILAAIAIPVFLSQREKAADSATKSDLKNAATVMETEYVDAQTYAGVVVGDFNTTEGVTLTITTQTVDAFCIDAANDGGSDTDYHYNSATGGLLEGTCAVPA